MMVREAEKKKISQLSNSHMWQFESPGNLESWEQHIEEITLKVSQSVQGLGSSKMY